MAREKNGNYHIDDNEKTYLGTGDDGEVYYDGTDIQIITPSGISIVITPGANANIYLDTMKFPSEDGTFGQRLTTSGNAVMYWSTEAEEPPGPSPPEQGDRGLFAGGTNLAAVKTNIIDYITISSVGNATDFGDMLSIISSQGATSNGGYDRGVNGGGYSTARLNVIQYITISSPGNASDFGDLTEKRDGLSACSNNYNDRAVFGGGTNDVPVIVNTMDYFTISSAGNASDFGNLTHTKEALKSCSNGANNRGIFAGGKYYSGGWTYYNVIEYITINSAGNAIDFGDLLNQKYALSSTSNGTNERGVFGGGIISSNESNVIDYITISSTGNATNFGDLTVKRYSLCSTSNTTNERGVFGGGADPLYTGFDVIDYITINSAGDATDFGNLTVARGLGAAISNA